MVNKLSSDLQEEIRKTQSVLKSYAELQAKLEVEQNKVKIVTKIIYKDKEVPIPAGKVFVKLEDGTYQEVTSMKFNYSDFRLDIAGDAVKEELSYKLHQKFRVTFVEAQRPGGVINHYAELYELDDKGNDATKLTLTAFKVVKTDDLKPTMMWWNPKLDMGLGYAGRLSGKHGLTGTIGVSLSAYGKTPNDLSWRFFRFGAGLAMNNGFLLDFSPAMWNLGSVLPLVSNLYVFPYFGLTFDNTLKTDPVNALTFGLGLSVTF